MQLSLPLLAVALIALTGPVQAACTVGVPTPGVLKLSPDGKTLSSGQAGGLASIIVISDITLQLGGTDITLSNLRLDTQPAGFAEPITLAASYSANWLLGSSSGSLMPSATFTVPAVTGLVVTITLNNSVTSNTGFRQGAYATKTSVTCS
jgi:hypothetical protein